jgi:two-component system sensor histidine kinase AtoS
VVTLDAQGFVTDANPAALELLGLAAAELVGSRGHGLLLGGADFADSAASAGSAGSADSGGRERRIVRRDGKRLTVHGRRSLLPCTTGQAAAVETIDDRTALVELEARVRSLDKMAALGTMAGGIAHEIRNPLNAARGFAALMQRELASGGVPGPDRLRELERWAKRIVSASDEAESIIASLLSFARPERLEIGPVDPAALLDEAVAASSAGPTPAAGAEPAGAAGRAPVYAISADSRAPRFRGDRLKLRQALRNLVQNAIEAQPAGGRIALRAELAPGPNGARIRLAVADAGPGFEPELAARALEPFFTTRAEGTGLGLALVHTIAQLHGGSVDVKSHRSSLGGAEVEITFPYVSAEPSPCRSNAF